MQNTLRISDGMFKNCNHLTTIVFMEAYYEKTRVKLFTEEDGFQQSEENQNGSDDADPLPAQDFVTSRVRTVFNAIENSFVGFDTYADSADDYYVNSADSRTYLYGADRIPETEDDIPVRIDLVNEKYYKDLGNNLYQLVTILTSIDEETDLPVSDISFGDIYIGTTTQTTVGDVSIDTITATRQVELSQSFLYYDQIYRQAGTDTMYNTADDILYVSLDGLNYNRLLKDNNNNLIAFNKGDDKTYYAARIKGNIYTIIEYTTESITDTEEVFFIQSNGTYNYDVTIFLGEYFADTHDGLYAKYESLRTKNFVTPSTFL